MTKREILKGIYREMQELSDMVMREEYFTFHGEFDKKDFRKWQWKLFGKIDMLFQLDLLSIDDYTNLRNHIRNIGLHYRNRF